MNQSIASLPASAKRPLRFDVLETTKKMLGHVAIEHGLDQKDVAAVALDFGLEAFEDNPELFQVAARTYSNRLQNIRRYQALQKAHRTKK